MSLLTVGGELVLEPRASSSPIGHVQLKSFFCHRLGEKLSGKKNDQKKTKNNSFICSKVLVF